MGLLYYLSYVCGLAAFAFVTLSLASGLLYLSELIEEHSRLAKLIGQRSIYAIILLHVIFYFTDSLPILQTAFSAFCHVVYLQNFSNTWPFISLTSISFLVSCGLVVADHFVWFFYFARVTAEARHLRSYRGIHRRVPGFTEIASFFGLCVWFIPLFLFLSLSANDNALPMAANTSSPMTPTFTTTTPRVSLIRSILSYISFDRIPRIASRRRDKSEGILAPRTPVVPASPFRSSTLPLPPRSPVPRIQELDVPNYSMSSNFKLDTPPRRSGSQSSDTGISAASLRRHASFHGKND